MNKYRDKSDFEINKAVAKRYLTHDFRLNSTDEIVELIDVYLYREYGGEFNLANKYVIGKFDPCNNPADAMPIVIRSLISLISDKSDDGESAWWVAQDVTGSIASGLKSNPYRAAMEVFLMMKDAENEK
ncbi:TPA: DUF2591 family protein [Morganella morganii]|nr:DUF2591 family protein [Morganella morganii]